MDATIKQKWVEALRSGEYPQTIRSLHCEEPRTAHDGVPISIGYCCLGVLLKVVQPVNTLYAYHPLDQKPIGLTSEQQDRCMTMNDDQKLSFSEIADVIEKEFV